MKTLGTSTQGFLLAFEYKTQGKANKNYNGAGHSGELKHQKSNDDHQNIEEVLLQGLVKQKSRCHYHARTSGVDPL